MDYDAEMESRKQPAPEPEDWERCYRCGASYWNHQILHSSACAEFVPKDVESILADEHTEEV